MHLWPINDTRYSQSVWSRTAGARCRRKPSWPNLRPSRNLIGRDMENRQKYVRLAGLRNVPNTEFLTTRPWHSVFAIQITKLCAATRCLITPSAGRVMYYKLVHVQEFRSSSDVVLLLYYEFQRKEDGPESLSAVKGGTFIRQMSLDFEPRN